MSYLNFEETIKLLCTNLRYKDKSLVVTNPGEFRRNLTDSLVYHSVFCDDPEIRKALSWIIREVAISQGAIPESIQSFYEAKGKGKYSKITVPAINIRGLTYDTARTIFNCALKNRSKTVIFEIAKTEIGYTKQRPLEYSTLILGAALREGYSGPIFIQGDHFQVNAKKYAENPKTEIAELKELIKEAIEADFYNIDIDASTTVDLTKSTVTDQQFSNYEITAELTKFIRERQPAGIMISVGGEIGEVGGKNSTVTELKAFLSGYRKSISSKGKDLVGISKISVQTGTSHGGVVLPDGTIAKVKLDFETLKSLSAEAKKSGLAGAVQHGASTLPEEAFGKFPDTDTAEIHLATGFQNIIMDSPHLPLPLKNRIIEYIHDNFINEKKEGETDEQFVYKTRKKAFGPFKKELFEMQENIKDNISKELFDKLDLLFKKLNAINTDKYIDESVMTVKVPKEPPVSVGKLISK
jgi:fructose/tagatose bisphosphate aldolase